MVFRPMVFFKRNNKLTIHLYFKKELFAWVLSSIGELPSYRWRTLRDGMGDGAEVVAGDAHLGENGDGTGPVALLLAGQRAPGGAAAAMWTALPRKGLD